jgi:hypothetical protein
MTEPVVQSPEELLARALESLSSTDRQRVTMWLLSRVSPGLQLGWLGKSERDHLSSTLTPSASYRELFGLPAGGVPAGEYQVVPVRLPADLHARLRKWSVANGFSMATVVRGLVSKFLDGQEA